MRWECRERFPRHRLQRKPLVSDPGMHHGTCVTHVPWCMSGSLTRDGGENVPGKWCVIPIPYQVDILFYRRIRMGKRNIWQNGDIWEEWLFRFETQKMPTDSWYWCVRWPLWYTLCLGGKWSNRLLGLYSLSGKMSNHEISWNLEASRLGVMMIASFWNLTDISAATLPRCMSDFRAVWRPSA